MTPIFVDPSLLVMDKPAGWLAVPGRTQPDCLATRVQQQWPDARVVHRLDMATSGLMVFARGPAAQRTLSMAFEARRVQKRYVAVVQGLLAQDEGLIDLPLGADWPRRPMQKVDPDQGKPSITRWRVMARDTRDRSTRLELEPVTGRTHQLRVHLCAIGHAILGDTLYTTNEAGTPRLMLHATRLELAHPLDGRALALDCPPPF